METICGAESSRSDCTNGSEIVCTTRGTSGTGLGCAQIEKRIHELKTFAAFISDLNVTAPAH